MSQKYPRYEIENFLTRNTSHDESRCSPHVFHSRRIVGPRNGYEFRRVLYQRQLPDVLLLLLEQHLLCNSVPNENIARFRRHDISEIRITLPIFSQACFSFKLNLYILSLDKRIQSQFGKIKSDEIKLLAVLRNASVCDNRS